MFNGALHHGAPVVVVDNTNTRRWEYDFYLRMGRIFKYAVVVVEIQCSSPDIAKRFAQRVALVRTHDGSRHARYTKSWALVLRDVSRSPADALA